jgi:hypothetical protein
VPTLPLFVHERLSTAAIVRTLEDHRRRPDQGEIDDLFGDPRMPLSRQVNAHRISRDERRRTRTALDLQQKSVQTTKGRRILQRTREAP